MKSRAILAAFSIILVRSSDGGKQAIRLTLDVEKKAYHVGDVIHFHLVYKNISKRQILVLTVTEVHLVKIFAVKRVTDGRSAEDILGPGEVNVAWEELAKKAVHLAPGARTKREICDY
jgi:hypothetical protein